MASSEAKLHFAVFPWLAYGHLIPFLELTKFLARRGHKVSFVSTSRNIDRLLIPPDVISLINFVKLSLPHDDCLPENAEGTMEINPDRTFYLKKAYDETETQVTRFFEESIPDVVVYDFAPYWLGEVATRLRVYKVCFCVFNALFLGSVAPSTEAMTMRMNRQEITAEFDDFLVGGEKSIAMTELEKFIRPPDWVPFETKATCKPYELIRSFRSIRKNQVVDSVSDVYRLGRVIDACDAMVIRHWYEFEGDWLRLLEKLHRNKPVIPLGLIPPAMEAGSSDETWVRINTWLDSQKRKSVLYVALGTEFSLSQEELTELALGLEFSGLPFFWTLKKPPTQLEDPEAAVELPEGFEERVKDRGFVWQSWAPQLKILSHASVGGFLTHCGWNSIVEGLMYGHPLVMLPCQAEQGLTARVLEDRELGIEIPRSKWEGNYTKESVSESIKLVMEENEGKKFRDRAKELGSIFGDRELHDSYLEKFLEFVSLQRFPKSTIVDSLLSNVS